MNSSLRPPDDDDEASVELYRMLAAFPAREGQAEVSVALRVEAYFTAVGELPAWALRKAVDDVLRGVAGFDERFAPTPPQLAKLARQHMSEAMTRRHKLRLLLDAKVDAPLPSAEQREKRLAQFEELRRSLAGSKTDEFRL